MTPVAICGKNEYATNDFICSGKGLVKVLIKAASADVVVTKANALIRGLLHAHSKRAANYIGVCSSTRRQKADAERQCIRAVRRRIPGAF